METKRVVKALDISKYRVLYLALGHKAGEVHQLAFGGDGMPMARVGGIPEGSIAGKEEPLKPIRFKGFMVAGGGFEPPTFGL